MAGFDSAKNPLRQEKYFRFIFSVERFVYKIIISDYGSLLNFETVQFEIAEIMDSKVYW